MLTYKEIEKEDLASLAAMYVETFNAPPWNDAWTRRRRETRLRQMAESGKPFTGSARMRRTCYVVWCLGLPSSFMTGCCLR